MRRLSPLVRFVVVAAVLVGVALLLGVAVTRFGASDGAADEDARARAAADAGVADALERLERNHDFGTDINVTVEDSAPATYEVSLDGAKASVSVDRIISWDTGGAADRATTADWTMNRRCRIVSIGTSGRATVTVRTLVEIPSEGPPVILSSEETP